MPSSNIARFCLIAGTVNCSEESMGKRIANALGQDIEILNAFGIKGYSPDSNILAQTKEEKPLHTYYCLFLPLGIYCGFGAENIHHAYNKAAKYWGARNQVGRPYDDMPESKIQKDCRIYVFDDIRHVSLTRKEVTHTLMTKLVKAWREENP